MKGLPFKAGVEDVLKFYQGFSLTSSSIYLKRHADGRLNGEVGAAAMRGGGGSCPVRPLWTPLDADPTSKHRNKSYYPASDALGAGERALARARGRCAPGCGAPSWNGRPSCAYVARSHHV
jgi:hypothetical protein